MSHEFLNFKVIIIFFIIHCQSHTRWDTKNKSIDSLLCSSPRKSLVKGERFMRGMKRNQSDKSNVGSLSQAPERAYVLKKVSHKTLCTPYGRFSRHKMQFSVYDHSRQTSPDTNRMGPLAGWPALSVTKIPAPKKVSNSLYQHALLSWPLWCGRPPPGGRRRRLNYALIRTRGRL